MFKDPILEALPASLLKFPPLIYITIGIGDSFLSVCHVFQSLMNTNKEEMRELAAQLYAVVVSTMSGSELNTAVHNLVKITKDNHVRYCLPPPSVE